MYDDAVFKSDDGDANPIYEGVDDDHVYEGIEFAPGIYEEEPQMQDYGEYADVGDGSDYFDINPGASGEYLDVSGTNA